MQKRIPRDAPAAVRAGDLVEGGPESVEAHRAGEQIEHQEALGVGQLVRERSTWQVTQRMIEAGRREIEIPLTILMPVGPGIPTPSKGVRRILAFDGTDDVQRAK